MCSCAKRTGNVEGCHGAGYTRELAVGTLFRGCERAQRAHQHTDRGGELLSKETGHFDRCDVVERGDEKVQLTVRRCCRCTRLLRNPQCSTAVSDAFLGITGQTPAIHMLSHIIIVNSKH